MIHAKIYRPLWLALAVFGLLLAMLMLGLSFGPWAGKTQASSGTPVATLEVPGTFEAEDFNTGVIYDVYFAYDSQGYTPSVNLTANTTYRTDAAHVDIVDYATDGETYVVSSYNVDPPDPEPPAPPIPPQFEFAVNYSREYLKYTVDVEETGWYIMKVRGAHGGTSAGTSISISIDNVQKGYIGPFLPAQSEPPHVPSNAAEYYLRAVKDKDPRPLYLTAGEHVLTIHFNSPGTFLDSITFEATSDPGFGAPFIVTPTSGFEQDEVIIAHLAPNLDTTGTTDVSGDIQDAIDELALMGGGTLFLRAGTYLIETGLEVYENVVLRGEWRNPVQGEKAAGTLLKVTDTTKHAVNLKGINATLRDISIYYPDQGTFAPEFTPTPYPCTIYSNALLVRVHNVTLYNSYEGICFRAGGANGATIDHVYGTFLNKGIELGRSYEFSFLTQVLIDPDIWLEAPSPVVAPNSGQEPYLREYLKNNLYAINIYHNDALNMYDISVNGAQRDIALLQQAEDSNRCPYGAMGEIHARVYEECLHPDVTAEYPNIDQVWQARPYTYVFASGKMPANPTALVNVKDFGAVGDGVTDDVYGIQWALNYAYTEHGGGTVILPPGNYVVSGNLEIPEGVELRGSHDYIHSHSGVDLTVLLAYAGKDTEDDETETAFITLNDNSGIRGFSIYYPEQGFVDPELDEEYVVVDELQDLYPVRPFPYTVRSAGEGTWAQYIEIENGYNGFDFASTASDDFLLSGIWMNVLNKGAAIGADTDGGAVEKAIVSYGNHVAGARWNAPKVYGWQDMHEYVLANTEPINVGNSSNIRIFGFEIYASGYGFRFTKQGEGSGPQNLQIYMPGTDNSLHPSLLAEGGGTINVFGLAGAARYMHPAPGIPYLKSTSTFNGTLNVYESLIWGDTVLTPVNQGGTINVYKKDLMNYSLPVSQGKPAVDPDSSPTTVDGPQRAVDGSNTSKWYAPTTDDKTLEIDLGRVYSIKRWRVLHAGVNGEPQTLNTRNFHLQSSLDGMSWNTVDTVSGNSANVTDRLVSPAQGQYFRLVITQGTHVSEDDFGRIYDFALFAELDVYANSYYESVSPPYKDLPKYAVDYNEGSKWSATDAETSRYWLRVDLGREVEIDRWVVKHAATDGVTSSNYNTSNYYLEVSTDGTKFTTVDSVGSNSSNSTDLTFTPVTARYVRLNVTSGTQLGYDGYARIQEFQVFSTADDNVTEGQPVVANDYYGDEGRPKFAVDDSTDTGWTSHTKETAGEYWLVVDLGQTYKIEKWIVMNEPSYVNTHYALQLSMDGTLYTTVDTVGPSNGSNTTDETLATPTNARFAKLRIIAGGPDGYARVREFRVQD